MSMRPNVVLDGLDHAVDLFHLAEVRLNDERFAAERRDLRRRRLQIVDLATG